MFQVLIQLLMDAVIDWVNIVYRIITEKDLISLAIQGIYNPTAVSDKIPFIEGMQVVMMIIAYGILIVNIYLVFMRMISNGINGERNKIIKSIFVVIVASLLIYYKEPVLMAIAGFFNFAIDKILYLLGDVQVQQVKAYYSANISDNMIFLCMLIAIALAEMRAVITYLERLVTYMIYMLMYPICLAFSVSQETMNTFKEWFIGVLSQGFGIIMSFAFLKMGMAMQGVAFASGIHIDGFFSDDENKILALVLCVVLYSISNSTEKLLSPFGMKTMNHGSAGNLISLAAGTATSMVSQAARTGTRLGMKGIKAGAANFSEWKMAKNQTVPAQLDRMRNVGSSNGGFSGYNSNKNESVAKQKGREMASKYSKMYGNNNSKSDSELRQIAEANGVFDTNKYKTFSGKSKKMSENEMRFAEFKDGYNSEMKERRQLSDNLNNVLKNGEFKKDKDGNTIHMSNQDVARATNLDSTYPSFTPNPKGKAQILTDDNGNSAILVNGTVNKGGREVEKNIAIGKSDIADGNSSITMKGKGFEGSQVELSTSDGNRLYTADSKGEASNLYAYDVKGDYIKPSKNGANATEAKERYEGNNELFKSVDAVGYQNAKLGQDIEVKTEANRVAYEEGIDKIQSSINENYAKGGFIYSQKDDSTPEVTGSQINQPSLNVDRENHSYSNFKTEDKYRNSLNNDKSQIELTSSPTSISSEQHTTNTPTSGLPVWSQPSVSSESSFENSSTSVPINDSPVLNNSSTSNISDAERNHASSTVGGSSRMNNTILSTIPYTDQHSNFVSSNGLATLNSSGMNASPIIELYTSENVPSHEMQSSTVVNNFNQTSENSTINDISNSSDKTVHHDDKQFRQRNNKHDKNDYIELSEDSFDEIQLSDNTSSIKTKDKDGE